MWSCKQHKKEISFILNALLLYLNLVVMFRKMLKINNQTQQLQGING